MNGATIKGPNLDDEYIDQKVKELFKKYPTGAIDEGMEIKLIDDGTMRSLCHFLMTEDEDKLFNVALKMCLAVSFPTEARNLLIEDEIYVRVFVDILLYSGKDISFLAALYLSNLTNQEEHRKRVLDCLTPLKLNLEKIIVRCVSDFDPTHSSPITNFICNISSNYEVRNILLTFPKNIMDSYFSIMNTSQSDDRNSIMGCLRNLTFIENEDDGHLDELFNKRYVFYMLLPLYVLQDITELPFEFKTSEDKEGYSYTENTRIAALECIYKICRFKKGRLLLRNTKIYEFLRDFHLHLQKVGIEDGIIIELCEDVVNVLIREEGEIEYSDLEKAEMAQLAIDDAKSKD